MQIRTESGYLNRVIERILDDSRSWPQWMKREVAVRLILASQPPLREEPVPSPEPEPEEEMPFISSDSLEASPPQPSEPALPHAPSAAEPSSSLGSGAAGFVYCPPAPEPACVEYAATLADEIVLDATSLEDAIDELAAETERGPEPVDAVSEPVVVLQKSISADWTALASVAWRVIPLETVAMPASPSEHQAKPDVAAVGLPHAPASPDEPASVDA